MLITTDARALQRPKFFYEAPVTLDNINCHGTEDSLTDCPGSVYGNFGDCLDIAVTYCEGMTSTNATCEHIHDLYFAFLSIVAQPCNETNATRLTYGTITIGRLEVCTGGYWGTVCSLGTTNATATVACRQLNHAAVGKTPSYVGQLI